MTRALVTTVDADTGSATTQLTDVGPDQLGEGELLIDVTHSSINYKDALALRGTRGVARISPLIAGIDAVGTVRESDDPAFSPGDEVLLNGEGLGETRPGGYTEQLRLPAAKTLPLPDGITAWQAAALGTAGFTAALSVLAVLDAGTTPGDGPVLVTGATGGVGTIAVSLLAHAGFEVTASTGRREQAGALLEHVGATHLIDRTELSDPGKPLQSERWAAVVDCVGSHTLANALAQTRAQGVVTACGLAQGADLPGSVHPLILRGVRLQGITSIFAPREQRERAWNLLAQWVRDSEDFPLPQELVREVPLEDVPEAAEALLAGQVLGRQVVSI